MHFSIKNILNNIGKKQNTKDTTIKQRNKGYQNNKKAKKVSKNNTTNNTNNNTTNNITNNFFSLWYRKTKSKEEDIYKKIKNLKIIKKRKGDFTCSFLKMLWS